MDGDNYGEVKSSLHAEVKLALQHRALFLPQEFLEGCVQPWVGYPSSLARSRASGA